MGPEAVILAAWGGESGRGRHSAREVPGVGGGGAAEFQKSSFSKKRTLGNLHWGSVVDPKRSLGEAREQLVLVISKRPLIA